MARGPWHEEFDLIVVGGSVGGLAAAIIAADRGGRVVVIERAKDLGGGAGSEAEAIAAGGTRFQQALGLEDSPTRLAADIQAAARHHVEPDVVAAVSEQGPAIVAWLADRCGAAVQLLTGEVNAGHSVPRLHSPGERGGASLVAHLSRAATRHSHVSVRTGTVAERLVRAEAGNVQGVAVRTERRGVSQTLAGSVVLACGGFGADDELIGAHCAAVAALPYGGSAGAGGDNLRLGREAGAQTRRLGAALVTPFLAMPGQLAVTAPLVDLGGILVNQAGRRFVDETTESLPLAIAVRAQPGRVAYLLFDERMAATARNADPFFAHVVLPRAGRRAEALVDLAKQFELDGEGLALTVDTFNGNLELGGDPFGRERFHGRLEPPFHAIRVSGARLRTLGGLAIDATARVLDAEGRGIGGLYAAGGAAAGLAGEGTEGALAGTDALAALALARLAALDVVARAARDERGGEGESRDEGKSEA
jgi:fumarate reductase flavoprotein subunit